MSLLLAIPATGQETNSYTVELSDAEAKAFTAEVISTEDWINNLVHDKARKCIDAVVLEYSDKQPDKLSLSDKNTIVNNADIVTAAEKQEQRDIEAGYITPK